MLSSSPYGFQSCWSPAVSRVQLVLLGWKHWQSLLTFVCLCVQWPSSVASSCWSCLCLSCSTTSPKRWVPPAPPIDTPSSPPNPQGSIMEDGVSTSSHINLVLLVEVTLFTTHTQINIYCVYICVCTQYMWSYPSLTSCCVVRCFLSDWSDMCVWTHTQSKWPRVLNLPYSVHDTDVTRLV